MSIIALLLVILLLAIPIAGIFVLILGVRGRIDLSQPTCSQCRYELREVLIAKSEHCPECGNALAPKAAVQFGRARRSIPLIVIGLIMILGLPALSVVSMFAMTTARGAAAANANAAAANAAAANAAAANAAANAPAPTATAVQPGTPVPAGTPSPGWPEGASPENSSALDAPGPSEDQPDG